jgi:hypothetical protein
MKQTAPLALALAIALSACSTAPLDTATEHRPILTENDYVTGSRLPQKGAKSLGKMSEEDKQSLERELSNATNAVGTKRF